MERRRDESRLGGGSPSGGPPERHAAGQRHDDDSPVGFGYGRRDYPITRGYAADSPGYETPERGVWFTQVAERGRHAGKGPKGYTRSDERIWEDICEKVIAADIDASDVDITVESGEVTLAGSVRFREDKHRIEDIADEVPGVRSVHSRIRTSAG